MEERKLVEIRAGALRLTPEGRDLGLRVLRAHRLWESYLADRTAFPETEWHGRAHTLEHGLSNEQVDALAAQLQHPTHDPHGDPIPTADGQAERPDGIPIAEAPAGRALRVVHIEDEPDAVYSQLVAEGIFPGMMLRVAEMSVTRVRLISASSEHVLAPLVAANITVEVLPEEEALEPEGGVSLDTLAVGESGRVLSLSPRCRGAERRRLMDLGVLPGTILTVEMRSPSGDPTAYWIRGALIALRTEQASWLRVERVPHKDAEEAA